MFKCWNLVVGVALCSCFCWQNSALGQQPGEVVGVQTNQAQQQPLQQPPSGQGTAELALVDRVAIPIPQQPFEITAQEAEYMEKLLGHWQTSSERVRQFSCQFKRFDYDSENVNYRDPKDNRLAAASIRVGEIRYAAPDRGFYECTRTWVFKSPPTEPGGDAVYDELQGDTALEKWICDGSYVYEFDYTHKVLFEDEIPAEMRGAQIVNSPIPFLFGARKDDILNRYWARPIAQQNENEFWIEAYPKRIDDARMYSKVEIILAREDFLPKAIHVYLPQYNPQKGNFESRYFMLENREVNDRLAKFQDFMGIFVKPQLPAFGGWRRMERMAVYQDKQASGMGNDRK
jgi:TIGR03009 family protein